MKVYFTNNGLEGSYNVRCLFPLQENGWDGDRVRMGLERISADQKAKAVVDADIVVFHRPEAEYQLEMAKKLKEAGKKIVFDNDDTYKDHNGFKFNDFMTEEKMKVGLDTLNQNIGDFIKIADLVTCTTEALKKEYAEINPNVVVLPNCVDPFYYPEPKRNETDIVRIGITGSVGITSDVEVLKPIIEKYQNDPRVRLVLLSLPPEGDNAIYKKLYVEEYAFWNKVNIEWHSFVSSEIYYDYLNNLKLDMVVIPRKDTYFNRCKSNLKFLECSMLEIPVIGQSFPTGDSPYEVDPEDAKHLLLATDTDSWYSQIEKLIADKELRREMGKKAREYVTEKYSIENNAHKWADAYSTLTNK
jgi:glycosyltransferase involved in cell wall biosynthesis